MRRVSINCHRRLCLALATDIRITSATAKLGVTFVGLGLHPGMGATHFLPNLIGNQAASRLLLTGEVISGAEAENIFIQLIPTPPPPPHLDHFII